MADGVAFYDEIEAYCSRLSYAPSDTVELHVSTRAARYEVSIERGAQRELVWSSDGPVDGRLHPVPVDADARSCRCRSRARCRSTVGEAGSTSKAR